MDASLRCRYGTDRSVPTRARRGFVTAPASRARADDRRLRILRVAREACAEHGYADARMDQVAAAAQVSKGTLYHHFASKEALFEAALLAKHDEALHVVREALDTRRRPRERVRDLKRAFVGLLPEIAAEMPVNMQIWGVVAGDASARARVARALADVYAAMSQALRATLREGIAAGEFAEDLDVEAFTSGLIAMLDGFIYRSTFDDVTPAGLEASLDVLLRERLDGAGGADRG